MDRRSLKGGACNGGGKNPAPLSPAAGSRAPAAGAAGSTEDAGGGGERKALLPRQPSGGSARKSQSGSKRRVQWKDSHGKKLTEVLEFEPSDSSDSDDEYVDTCICSVM